MDPRFCWILLSKSCDQPFVCTGSKPARSSGWRTRSRILKSQNDVSPWSIFSLVWAVVSRMGNVPPPSTGKIRFDRAPEDHHHTGSDPFNPNPSHSSTMKFVAATLAAAILSSPTEAWSSLSMKAGTWCCQFATTMGEKNKTFCWPNVTLPKTRCPSFWLSADMDMCVVCFFSWEK